MIKPPRLAHEVARGCRAWLDMRGFGVIEAANHDAGSGIAVLLAQVEGTSFFVVCRGDRRVHPTRAHVRRTSLFRKHRAVTIAVRSTDELENQIRRYFLI